MIYPEYFPDDRKNEIAEQKVFDRLKTVSDKYDIFYSRKFVSTGKFQRPEYEIDFIIVIPDRAILCLEVKGGIINYSGIENRWSQNSRTMSKDPDIQASSAMHSLIKSFSDLIGEMAIGWGLCFPDCDRSSDTLPPSINERQIIDQLKLLYVETTLEDTFEFIQDQNSTRTGVRRWQYEKFKSQLLRDIGFVQILSTKMKYDENRFIQLTNDQIRLFDRLKSNNKIITEGPAGSGKTIIAKTLANDKLANGNNVLFMCYNRTLANKIRYEFGRYEDKIEVTTFHSFAKKVIDTFEANWWRENINTDDFWDILVPIKLEELMPFYNESYDCIIIDEGQDFEELWFELIFNLSTKNEDIYIFLDKMQNIFGRKCSIPRQSEFITYTLSENCRNTKSIVSYLSETTGETIPSFNDAPEGDKVVTKKFQTSTDQKKFLVSEITSLINEHKIDPEQILILLNSEKTESSIHELSNILRYKVLSLDNKARFSRDKIHYTTINTFKGLEADIVFIVDTNKIDTRSYKQTIYTEASRAKHKLYLLTNNN